MQSVLPAMTMHTEPLVAHACALSSADVAVVIRDVKHWLERAVIGLNLCPFAKAVHVKRQIHFAVSGADTWQGLLDDLEKEATQLLALDSKARDTTLLIAPWCPQEFLEFSQFLRQAQRLLARRGLDAELQIASFHPRYQFADAAEDDIGNFTNRAPYPVLHLLREASVATATLVFADAEAIYGANLRTLAALGREGWDALEIGATLDASENARGR
jgi:uncharacterized protein